MNCIYLIKNKVNGKPYVGQSIEVERRWAEHRRSSSNVKALDYNTPLHRAFRKYGIDNFEFSILESHVPHGELNSRENHYMRELQSLSKGYNQTITSRNGISPEELNKRRELKYGVTKEKLKSQLISGSFASVSKLYGVSDNAIRKWCKSFGLPTKASYYETDEKKRAYATRMSQVSKDSSANKRKVNMVDLSNGEVLMSFQSIADAGSYVGVKYSNISRVLSGERKTAKGYSWEYAN